MILPQGSKFSSEIMGLASDLSEEIRSGLHGKKLRRQEGIAPDVEKTWQGMVSRFSLRKHFGLSPHPVSGQKILAVDLGIDCAAKASVIIPICRFSFSLCILHIPLAQAPWRSMCQQRAISLILVARLRSSMLKLVIYWDR
ncbi:MAG: hypothetical protein J5846_02275 [Desulfovibrio sp.]|nr:hypothetical protein [Desulfovibrio sp.]